MYIEPDLKDYIDSKFRELELHFEIIFDHKKDVTVSDGCAVYSGSLKV